jgi:hypothetical protein
MRISNIEDRSFPQFVFSILLFKPDLASGYNLKATAVPERRARNRTTLHEEGDYYCFQALAIIKVEFDQIFQIGPQNLENAMLASHFETQQCHTKNFQSAESVPKDEGANSSCDRHLAKLPTSTLLPFRDN